MSKKHVEIGYDAAAATLPDNGILPSDSLKGGTIAVRTDNAALAIATISKGTPLYVAGRRVADTSNHDIPEGHRFATEDVPAGGELTSWGIAFGVALVDIKAGQLLSNLKSIGVFKDRQSTLDMPAEPNFRNATFKRFKLQPEDFTPGKPTAELAPKLSAAQLNTTFQGYQRPGTRGAGTRNYIVLVGVSSQAGGFVRALEAEYHHVIDAARKFGGSQAGCDGVVAVAHTEGGLDAAITSNQVPNNMNKVVRTLAGMLIHPNVGAVLLVDQGSETVRVEHVLKFIADNQYPTDGLQIETLRLAGKSLDAALAEGRAKIDSMLETVRQQRRQPVPLKEIILALQCGGSDAFSGISANPLAGWMARYLTCCGGYGLLAETDELIGAEGYVLHSVRNFETADHFLQLIDRYYRYTNNRGHSPEGNPSGGNLYRGLYNITLKSAGAAMKKLPDTRLDHVIEYGELLRRHPGGGYSFMDSPGNDLESIAGQVGSGSNMILFTTGNGSVTNFPFVPTLKALTTTKRYQLLSDDMDINAGAYLDKELTLDQLGEQAIDLMVRAASGEYTKGEIAGHHQVQIWRDWSKLDGELADIEKSRMDPKAEVKQASAAEEVTHGQEQPTADDERAGKPLAMVDDNSPLITEVAEKLAQAQLHPTHGQLSVLPSVAQTSDKLGLILPTSLCSGQVAVIIVRRLNEKLAQDPDAFGVTRFVTLPHTEGCGHSSGSQEALVVRTMVSYSVHPLVVHAVMLEHGCEKTHNGRLELELQQAGANLERFAFSSVQLDGGLEKVAAKVESQFRTLHMKLAPRLPSVAREPAQLNQLRVGFLSALPVDPELQTAVGHLCQAICRGGGSVVLAGSLKGGGVLQNVLKEGKDVDSTLGFGQRISAPGLHIMGTSSLLPVELMTGLGATGVEVMVAVVRGEAALPAHPMIPVIQVAVASNAVPQLSLDLDVVLQPAASGGNSAAWALELAEKISQCLSRSGSRLPKLYRGPISDFQMPRTTGSVSM